MTSGRGALARVVARSRESRPAASDQRCDLCTAAVRDEHRHVLDERAGTLLCACRACALLFEPGGAGDGRYRQVPEGRTRLHLDLDPRAAGVPVGLAFFVRHADGQVSAHYPSPMGTTRSEVDAHTWTGLVARWPELGAMPAEVRALLVHTARGADEHWLVPIDDCYRLVAVVRRAWRGISGGTRVWEDIERFFAELAAPAGHR